MSTLIQYMQCLVQNFCFAFTHYKVSRTTSNYLLIFVFCLEKCTLSLFVFLFLTVQYFCRCSFCRSNTFYYWLFLCFYTVFGIIIKQGYYYFILIYFCFVLQTNVHLNVMLCNHIIEDECRKFVGLFVHGYTSCVSFSLISQCFSDG